MRNSLRAPLGQRYDHQLIESSCQKRWQEDEPFTACVADDGGRHTFVYSCTPFTTGSAHMGHVRSYTIADVCARWARKQGDTVLWAMGFDAFGLPNEIAAIERQIPPTEWVRKCCEEMRRQFYRLGLSVDWSREFVTSEAEYYRWTQWVFLRFLEAGLVYRADAVETWCEHCNTTLASLQVEDGCCWRCRQPAGLRRLQEWYLTLEPYAEELERCLDQLDQWDPAAVAFQRNLLRKTVGVEVDIPLPSGAQLTVFAPSPGRWARAEFVALSPSHPLIAEFADAVTLSDELERQQRRSLRRADRSVLQSPVLRAGSIVIGPGEWTLPVLVTPAVDVRYGGGAAFGFPGADRADQLLADQAGIATPEGHCEPVQTLPGRPAVRRFLRDSSVSRQRGWGAPVPVVYCEHCGVVPVPDEQLPVLLPDDLLFTGHGNPLAAHPVFADCPCPRCSHPAKRDTDTLDVHFDSIWMLIPFAVPVSERSERLFDHPDLDRWLPVSQVVCGADQVGWWINDRAFFKMMSDLGYFRGLVGREPVRRLLMHEMVLAHGRKMSKSLGNAVEPTALINRYGADALRLTILKVNPRIAFNWSEGSLQQNYKFLSSVWALGLELLQGGEHLEADDRPPNARIRRLEQWSEVAEQKVRSAYERGALHTAAAEVKFFFQLLQRFDSKRPSRAVPNGEQAALVVAFKTFLDLLEPISPHITATLLAEFDASAHEAAVLREPEDVGAHCTPTLAGEPIL